MTDEQRAERAVQLFAEWLAGSGPQPPTGAAAIYEWARARSQSAAGGFRVTRDTASTTLEWMAYYAIFGQIEAMRRYFMEYRRRILARSWDALTYNDRTAIDRVFALLT